MKMQLSGENGYAHFYRWQSDEDGYVRWYSVQKAAKLAAEALKNNDKSVVHPVFITRDEAVEMLSSNTDERDPADVAAVDLRQPLIAVQMPDGKAVVIDGWHRIEKFVCNDEAAEAVGGRLYAFLVPSRFARVGMALGAILENEFKTGGFYTN
jgi:hypothetical protein